jgi:hypothetical protein
MIIVVGFYPILHLTAHLFCSHTVKHIYRYNIINTYNAISDAAKGSTIADLSFLKKIKHISPLPD